MPILKVNMFGTPSVSIDGRVVSLPYKKADALLYYMILKPKVSRSELIGLLWADDDSVTALKNLRHAIYSIRKKLDYDLFLPGQRTMLEVNPQVEISCDVLDFLENGNLGCYQGEFLKDFSIHRASLFEDWLTEQRNLLQARYLKELLEVEKQAFRAGDFALAERYGLHYVAIDPLEESAVVVLMEIYGAQHKYRKAIGLYHDLCKNLSDEFSISPLKETTELYYKIVNEWNSSTYKVEEQSCQLLVGKELVLRKLLLLCNGSAQQQAPCVLIQGEAGVGKTYLLDHVLSHYDFSDWLVCRSSCYQSEMNVPLAPWNSIILTLVSEIETRCLSIPDSFLKTAAGLFPFCSVDFGRNYVAPDVDFPLQVNFHAAQENALLILSMVARKVPVLLVFEDIHWMDRSSVDMLALFLRRLHNQNITVICTSRDIFPNHVQAFLENAQRDKVLEQHVLRRFNREETGQFANYILDEEQPPEIIDQIYQNTEGNALLLVQLLNSIRESGDSVGLPQDPEGIISYRLVNLTVEERQVLDLISVFTDWAPFDTIASILTRDILELMYLCNQLKQRLLITESTRNGNLGYSLAHEKVKTILVKQQAESGRRILHLRVAQYLETQQAASRSNCYDRLIYHYAAGGDRFKAFQYRILSLNAFAGLCYELLPMLSPESDTQMPSEEGMLHYFQTLKRELDDLRACSVSAEKLDYLERVLVYAESRYCIHSGIYEKGLEALHSLVEHCTIRNDSEMLVKAHLQFVYYGIQIFDADVMEEHLKEIRKRLKEKSPIPELGIYLRLFGLLQLMRGCYHEARASLWDAIQTFQRLDPSIDGQYAIHIAGVYNYIGECYRLEGEYDKAFHYYNQAIIYNRSRGYYPGAAVFYTNYGVAAYQNGEIEVARQLFVCAMEIYQASHEHSEYPIALAYLAVYDAEEGNFSRAADRLQEALQVSDMIGSPWWKGITVYLSYRIRILLSQRGETSQELAAVWPGSLREHCLWALSFLKKLQPCRETAEMEAALQQLEDES